MNERLTIRLDDACRKALDERAALLGVSTAELARTAITASLGQQATIEKIAKMFSVLDEGAATRSAQTDLKIQRAFKLLFRVIEAPEEAESALEKIFK